MLLLLRQSMKLLMPFVGQTQYSRWDAGAALSNLLCFHNLLKESNPMDGEAGARDTHPGFRLPLYIN